MVQPKTHRYVTIAARIASGAISAGSLALCVMIVYEVFAPEFGADKPFYSVLPVGALSVNIVWNILALAAINKFHRFAFMLGDTTTALLIIILGSIGFAHDDRSYLSNGYYHYWDDSWLNQAIWGGIMMIAVVIHQLFLIGWAFMTPKPAPASDFLSSPPDYVEGDFKKDVKEKEKGFETDWQSVSSLEIPSNVERKM